MATQSRSASIPIPRSSSNVDSHNIESVISLPLSSSSSTNRLFTPTQPPARSSTAAWGIPGSSAGTRRASTGLGMPGASPTRSTARSFTLSSSIGGRASARSQVLPTFEPRVIRADTRDNNACLPSSSTSPTRTRRASGAAGRTPSTSRTTPSTSQLPIPVIPPHPPFPRPAYLAHSALRHLLQTEHPPSLPQRAPGSSSSGELHAYLVRNRRATVSGPIRRRGRDSVTPDYDDSDGDSSNISPPPSRYTRASGSRAADEGMLKLPTRWSEQVRHQSLSVSGDGRELTFNGPSSTGDREAAAARTDHPIPPACGIFYYEVEIVSKGQKGHISIGFAADDVKLSRLPGWEKNSWGYHGDDGFSFAAEKNGTPYGPKFNTGDIVGCGIDFSRNKAFYTKNGAPLGTVFDKVGTTVAIYPSVGLRHNGEAVCVNFGHEPFQFDIDDYVLQARNQTWASIMSTPLRREFVAGTSVEAGGIKQEEVDVSVDGATAGRGPINQLVLSYLSHHGYAKTARAFQVQCGRRAGLIVRDDVGKSEAVPAPPLHEDVDMDMGTAKPPPAPDATPAFDGWGPGMHHEDIELRTRIVNSVIDGDIDKALEETARYHPKVLEREEGLMLFKLRCRKFVELILEAAELKKRMKGEEGVGEVGKDIVGKGDGMDVDEELEESAGCMNGFGGNSSSSSAAIPIKAKRKQSMSHPGWTGAAAAQYETALNSAITYGQSLQSDYKTDSRPEVRAIFNRTFGIVAYDDPLEAGGDAAEVAGHEARMALATELNQDILQSQGRPAHPALERLYRQTAACVEKLGLIGVGAAAFADMPKEFLDA